MLTYLRSAPEVADGANLRHLRHLRQIGPEN
jgi:hypothetical protein